jgi:putative endonuclease
MTSMTNYHSGVAAEDIVARDYNRRGAVIANRRWRGQGGEVDLIVREGACVVFVEVKKSRSFARAAERLTRQQMDRIYASASEFIGGEPAGQLTEVRFDLALVDGTGALRIIENAFADA